MVRYQSTSKNVWWSARFVDLWIDDHGCNNILVWPLNFDVLQKRRFRRVTNFEKLRKFQPRNFNLNFVARYKAFVVFDIVYIIYSLQSITWLIYITWSSSKFFRAEKKPWKVGKSTDISSFWICQCRIGYVSYETRMPCNFMRCTFRPIRMQKHLRTQVRKNGQIFKRSLKIIKKSCEIMIMRSIVIWPGNHANHFEFRKDSEKIRKFRNSKVLIWGFL